MSDAFSSAGALSVEAPPPAAPATPEAAQAEKGFLMQDKAWTQRAMNPSSREWAHLRKLDEVIAGTTEAEAQAAIQREANPVQSEASFQVPQSPDDYELQIPAGMVADPVGVKAWKDGMHAAGVDRDLAAIMWQVAGHHAPLELKAADVNRQGEQAEAKLRGIWQGDYETRLAAANDEGKRLFERLPASLKDGMDYRTFMVATGLCNAPTLIQMLAERAAARTGKGAK